MIIGRIKTGEIKRASFELLERYPERFGKDFEENKRILEELNLIEEKKARNKVAGYLAHVIKKKAA
jgi:small subunit ribosomal protein S17e